MKDISKLFSLLSLLGIADVSASVTINNLGSSEPYVNNTITATTATAYSDNHISASLWTDAATNLLVSANPRNLLRLNSFIHTHSVSHALVQEGFKDAAAFLNVAPYLLVNGAQGNLDAATLNAMKSYVGVSTSAVDTVLAMITGLSGSLQTSINGYLHAPTTINVPAILSLIPGLKSHSFSSELAAQINNSGSQLPTWLNQIAQSVLYVLDPEITTAPTVAALSSADMNILNGIISKATGGTAYAALDQHLKGVTQAFISELNLGTSVASSTTASSSTVPASVSAILGSNSATTIAGIAAASGLSSGDVTAALNTVDTLLSNPSSLTDLTTLANVATVLVTGLGVDSATISTMIASIAQSLVSAGSAAVMTGFSAAVINSGSTPADLQSALKVFAAAIDKKNPVMCTAYIAGLEQAV